MFLLLACVTCVFPDLYMCVLVGRVFSFDCCFGGYKKIVENVHSALKLDDEQNRCDFVGHQLRNIFARETWWTWWSVVSLWGYLYTEFTLHNSLLDLFSKILPGNVSRSI